VHRAPRAGFIVVAFAAFAAPSRAQSTDARGEPNGHAREAAQLGPPDAATGAAPHAPHASSSGVDVAVASEVALYADSDHVDVFTPSIAGSLANVIAGWSVKGRYLVDVVSAASADVVSTASPAFVETRHVGTLEASYKPHAFGVAANAAVSVEPDYVSALGGATLTQELFDRSVSLLFGYSHMHDVAGRSGTPFSVFSRTLDRDGFKGGLSVVVDRATVVSFVGDVLIEYGDPSKPYRYVPLFAPGVVVPSGATIDQVDALRLSERALEQLPLARDRYALTMRWAHRFRRSTLRLDERAYVDTWGLKASTTDARVYFDLGRRAVVGPHLRFYGQTPVDFWQRAYVLAPGFAYPALRTGNRELGPLVDFTGGASFRAFSGNVAARTWSFGLDFNLTETRYLDDIYLATRYSFDGAVSFEVSL
jgi:hypothetical protein